MTVNPASLIAPVGVIEPDLFPGESTGGNKALLTRLTSYVNQGAAKTTGLAWDPASREDEAITAYAYYLAFRAAYTLALARPAEEDSATEVLGRVLYTEDQREGLKDLRDGSLAEFQALMADIGAISVASAGIPSHSVNTVFDY